MHPRKQAILELKDAKFFFYREGANHEIYKNDETGEIIPLKRHDFDESDLRYIRKEIKQRKERKH